MTMNTKQKILAALDYALDETSEARLLDILLDAYKSKKDEIQRLRTENQQTRQDLYNEREAMADERHKMRTDPLYSATGQYLFLVNHHKIAVTVRGARISISEKVCQVNYEGQQLPPEMWHSDFAK